MLTESARGNKENLIRWDVTAKEGGSLLQCTIGNLKEEVACLQAEKCMIEKQWIAEVDLLRL
jgi:hypothetical protein